MLPVLPENAFGRICEGREKISSGCPGWLDETKVIEIFCS